jgi:hypothetical protein
MLRAEMPNPARQRTHYAAALALAWAAGACGARKGDDAQGGARPDASTSAVPTASAPPPASAAAAASAEPVVEGVQTWKDIGANQAACSLHARALEPNLFWGGVSMASRRRELGMAWLLATHAKGEGLVTFGAYDTKTRLAIKSHGLGKAVAAAPKVFAGPDSFTVTWFDKGGLVYAHASSGRRAVEASRVPSIAAADAEHTAFIRTAAGPLLGAAPVRPDARTELGLFLLDLPDPEEPPAKALGVTKNANNPRHPALLEAGDGFLVAWEDASPGGASILVSHFDAKGSEDGERRRLPAPSAREPNRPVLAFAGPNVIAAWVETFRDAPTIFVRALDPSGAPLGPPYRVAEGTLAALSPLGGGAAALAFVSSKGLETENVFLVAITPSGRPAAEGYVVSDAKKSRTLVHALPSVALGDDGRLAVVFSYSVDMRFAMKTVAARCLLPAPETRP